ncbi:glycogen/starch/alpha-glucan phosphorylase [Candidatus Marithrix sp. Canyon 246]|uniref:glycogen/starch/alpha-glucan phosphorylase n=1 Tax=Candidatus Marithrix sp. Canyon 246 TaxID=1827136 RepID=UPI00084A1DAF|nr:glycogen/starch/alpha-glucan phosphorylase [Candidatus Marithrix sp. Canyon 246]
MNNNINKLNAAHIKEDILKHLRHTVAKPSQTATELDWFNALAYTLNDYLTEHWMTTIDEYRKQNAKRVYYLSLEFLTGRFLVKNLLNLGIYDQCDQVLKELGLSLEKLSDLEPDPALGNGGLGRLAACFLDSMASLNLPGYGYGIRYEYGMFYQRIHDGFQLEQPDNWLRYNNPWEFPRPELLYHIRFGGNIVEYDNDQGYKSYHWKNTDDVMAMAYDTPMQGYGTSNVNYMRLWAAKSSREFDLDCFNVGEYVKAVEDKNDSENLSKVLYPDDSTQMGRELRLRQEYFFISASIQDIIRRYLLNNDDIRNLADHIAIQLNDTHPVLAIPELLRLLLDNYHLSWNEAWNISRNIFGYTNHTLLPEALETWSVNLLEKLLPRHLVIIYQINHEFLQQVRSRYPDDIDILRRMSIIGEDGERHIRMSHLAIIGSHKVNGVAELHTHLMKTTLFNDFDRLYPDKIINKTNGITPRRWLEEANTELTQLINNRIGSGWRKDLAELKNLIPLANDENFCAEFKQIKHNNKQKLADFIQQKLGIEINPNSMFDVQIKRMHEYKRQLLNILHVITLYNRIRANPEIDIVPRTVIFAGKAAAGYMMAKLIIKLINSVADVVNNDLIVAGRLKVVFIPNYDVSNALKIIPAADLSEQISTAGLEASGTGNMKLALNGALTIGTLDGANIEIREEVGADNFFIFGLTTEGVASLRQQGYHSWDYYHANKELKQVLDMISSGYFLPSEPSIFQSIVDALTYDNDNFMLLADYEDYIKCQQRVDDLYKNQQEWTRKTILNVANMGKFSSDRTIKEYSDEIWGLKPTPIDNM